MTPREWLAVLVLTFTGTFLAMIFTTVAPVLPMMSARFGGGEHGAFVAGWLLTMPSIGVVVGGPLTGWSIERLGTRTVLFGCLAIYGVSGAAGAILQNDAALLASRLILGLAATGQVVAATGIIGEMFADERRGRMIGFQTAFATISGVASTLSSGALAEAAGWRAPFALYTLSFAVLALGIFTIRGQRREAISRPQSVRPASLLPFLPIYVFAMIANGISFFSTSQIPVLLSTDGVSAPSMISIVLGGGTLAFTAGASFYGKICAKFGTRPTQAVGLGLQGIGLICIALTRGIAAMSVGSIFLNVGGGLLSPSFSHRVLDLAPESIKGRALGLLFSAKFAGPFLNTAIIANMMTEFGHRQMLFAIGLLVVASVGLRAASSRINLL